jgi:ribosome-associated toxin RatA of RatAB toxin-antitoxin module
MIGPQPRGGTVAEIEHSIEISRPPDEVFAALNDVSRFGEWQPDIVSARVDGDGPVQAGTRVTSTRKLGKRELTTTTEVTEFSPPRSYSFRGIDGPVRPIGKGTVEPLDGGTRSRITFELDFEGHGPGKLLLPFIRRAARKQLAENHQRLKERLESGAT